MKRIILFLICCTVLSPFLTAEDPFTEELRASLEQIGRSHYRPIPVSLGSFTCGYGPLSGAFARYFEERVASALEGSLYFELFMSDAVTSFDPEFRKKYGEIFEVQEVEGVICGKYYDEGSTVRVSLEVVSLVDGSLIGKKDFSLDKTQIPVSASLLPAGYQKALSVAEELVHVVDTQQEEFSVEITTNRGSGAVFRDGEELVLYFSANKDAYVKVFHIDVDGNAALIFPNPFHEDCFISRGTLTQIPGKNHSYAFVLQEPYGVEFIKVLASTTPFEEVEESFRNLGAAGKHLLTRGLSVVQRQGKVAEALVEYTIVK